MDFEDVLDSIAANADLAEELYKEYVHSPGVLAPSWQQAFHQVDAEAGSVAKEKKRFAKEVQLQGGGDDRIVRLIDAYRKYGHLLAKVNPIATHPASMPDALKLDLLGFGEDELSSLFATCGLLPKDKAALSEIIHVLQSIYSDRVGIEYVDVHSKDLERWIQSKIEPAGFIADLPMEKKRMILDHLNRSELFESFLHTKYVGQKRFSIEGGETLIPVLAEIINKGSDLGAVEVVLGMAHRGRLNVLSNIMNKSYSEIFFEFEEGYIPESFEGTGDVKYHKGYCSEIKTNSGRKVIISLTPNPSHLESVDPVVEGQARGKQFLNNDTLDRLTVVPILIHGDAAISGQGVVYETMQMWNLPGYSTGGTIHIVINNQIGFTTLPKDSRSTPYCTDIAKSFNAPIFHVNAEDPEGCVFAAGLAIEMRKQFHCDVFIDLCCYRKYGHNESDEPAFTQPLEYQMIRKRQSIREIYRDLLISHGLVEKELAEGLEKEFKQALQNALDAKVAPKPHEVKKRGNNGCNDEKAILALCPTGVPASLIKTVTERLCLVPVGFNIHPKIENLVKERMEMGFGNKPIDWGMAETLAYATLLWEGIHIRISGQDVCRGTFSHRHAIWMDQKEEKAYFPLAHLKEKQGAFEIVNSPLSEMGVLGFEYGYSLACVDALVIWEAQFGDFANSAQVILDQYISSGEQKWGQRSGLTLLLPHGYEGQGPEHSSARMERYLNLAGHDNMIIANPTTPAQLFHLLRRQVLGPVHKPLIVFTPKGLLRHPACTSQVKDLSKGTFQEVIEDFSGIEPAEKLIFCSGRVYYDLIAAGSQRENQRTAFVRIEQLYPLHKDKIRAVIDKYKGVKKYLWVQEEPQNMGAWSFIQPALQKLLPSGFEIFYAGRSASASPATGSHAMHKKELAEIINAVFNKDKE